MPTPIKLYDSYQKKEIILDSNKTVVPNTLKMYSCGPTIYNYMHIGNLRAAWFPTSVRDVAKLAGWKVELVHNITDVGHLTGDNDGDADNGEDRVEKGAKRDGKTADEIINFYLDDYNKQCQSINIYLPCKELDFDGQPRASEYVKEQMILAGDLLQQNKAYLLDDGIYFDSQFNDDLFKMSQATNSQALKAILEIQAKRNHGNNSQFTGREIFNTTKNPNDFALWKFVSVDSLQKWRFKEVLESDQILGINSWVSKQSNIETAEKVLTNWGCPGWHSECVAMICQILGKGYHGRDLNFYPHKNETVIDLHTGGIEHMELHHKNEIIQSEAFGFQLATYWSHWQHVLVNGKKMSKSLGNSYLVVGKYENTGFYSLEHPPIEVQEKFKVERFDLLAYRLMLMEHHYTQQLDFTWNKLMQSQTRLFNIRKLGARILSFHNYQGIQKTEESQKNINEQKEILTKTLANNLDFPTFLSDYTAFLETIINKITKEQILVEQDLEILNLFDRELLKLKIFENPSQEAVGLAIARQNAKADKNWLEADSIRQQISQLGYQVDDYPWGYGLWLNSTLPKNSIQETL